VATIELAQQEVWRGNARAALDVLDGYRERFGETDTYLLERARALETGGRARAAIRILGPLVAERPDDYEARQILTVALSDAGRRRDALASLEELERIDAAAANPQTPETRSYVTAPIRSSARPFYEHYDDSDDVRHDLFGIEIGIELSPAARLVAAGSDTRVRSEPGSGLAPLSGDATVHQRGGEVGLILGLAGAGEIEGRIGGARVDDGGRDLLTWVAGLRLTPSDAIGLTLSGRREFHDVSARSLDLGIARTTGSAMLVWSPGVYWWIEAGGTRESYSDDNGRWEAALAITDGILRRQLVNVDLGVASRWQWFDENTDSGYYDPARYEQHLGVLSTYWKLGYEAGLSARLAAGAFRDDEIDDFERSVEVSGELTLGITTDWSLVTYGSWVDNARSVTGAFNATGAGIYLLRRF
jgi:hypothetical protein